MKSMLYLYLESRQLKIVSTKKALLGQQEVGFFNKRLEVDLLEKGKVANVDVLASALKEGLTSLSANHDKDVFLILPQESFKFMQADVPPDIAETAIRSFVIDKARSVLSLDIENCFYDYYTRHVDNQKHISYFAIDYDTLEKYLGTFKLLGLRLTTLLPETLAFFKLFEKTLRADKKENILYANYSKGRVSGYLFDSMGLISEEKWLDSLDEQATIEKVLREKVGELEESGTKLNRIILSGEESETVRQDTFTKNVGVWTNPLKRIIPNFYEEYVKHLVLPSKQVFPILLFDVCFGAFVFSQENREFQILKKPMKSPGKKSFSIPNLGVTKKDFLIFLASLVISFLVFLGVSNFSNLKLNFGNFRSPFTKPAPTPLSEVTGTLSAPTPTPAVDRSKLKIKILNGSGTRGKATDVKNLLSEKGYEDIVTGNADNFDFETTVIQVKKSEKDAGNVVAKDISDSVTSPKIQDLDEKETADIILTIGTDFK